MGPISNLFEFFKLDVRVLTVCCLLLSILEIGQFGAELTVFTAISRLQVNIRRMILAGGGFDKLNTHVVERLRTFFRNVSDAAAAPAPQLVQREPSGQVPRVLSTDGSEIYGVRRLFATLFLLFDLVSSAVPIFSHNRASAIDHLS